MAGSEDMDPRLHAYLDGELSASEAAQFKGDLRPGSALRNQLETLIKKNSPEDQRLPESKEK